MTQRFRHVRFLGAATLASLSALVPACSDAPPPDGAASPATPGVARPLVAAIQSDFRGPGARPALADVRGLAVEAGPTAPLGRGTVASIRAIGGALDVTLDEAERAAPSLVRVRLPAAADGATHLEDDRMAVDVRLRGGAPAGAALDDGFVVYRGGLGEADLVHRVSARGVEDFARFERAPAREELVYEIDLTGVDGLRLVGGGLELLTRDGDPRLRVAPPYVLASDGRTHDAALSVRGCAYDTSPASPWGRPVTAPGARTCTLVVSWSGAGVTYPALVDPSWSSTAGGMTYARYEHGAALVNRSAQNTTPEYLVLVAGGYNSQTAAYLASAELYNPATGTWSLTGPMSTRRAYHATISADGGILQTQATIVHPTQIVVTGGANATGYLASAEVYDAQAGTWSAMAPMTSPRAMHQGVGLFGTSVFVAGGYGVGGTVSSTSEYYDTTSGAWKPSTTNMSQGRVDFTLTGFMGSKIAQIGVPPIPARIVAAGGVNATGLAGTVEEYEWSATGGAWKPGLAVMKYPVHGHTALAMALGGKSLVVVAGGGNATVTTRFVQAWDKDTLAPVVVSSPLYTERMYQTAFALSATEMLLIGGQTNIEPQPVNPPWTFYGTSDGFDIGAGPVHVALPFPSGAAARSLPTATRLANGKIVVVGGVAKGGIALSDAFVYTP